MLNFITNLSLWVLFIKSHWSIFTLFQPPVAISCNCVKTTASIHSSSLTWRAEHPWSSAIAVYKSLGLYILVFLLFVSDSIDLEYFSCSLDVSNLGALGSTAVASLATLPFSPPPAAQSTLCLDPVVPDVYSIVVLWQLQSCQACQWTVVKHLHIYSLLKGHVYSTQIRTIYLLWMARTCLSMCFCAALQSFLLKEEKYCLVILSFNLGGLENCRPYMVFLQKQEVSLIGCRRQCLDQRGGVNGFYFFYFCAFCEN